MRKSLLTSVVFLAACSGTRGYVIPSDGPVDAGSAPDAESPPQVAAPDSGPAACTESPLDAPEVLREECGVFVAPSSVGATDERPGTRALPVATLQQGFDIAQREGKNWVFACAADYDQRLVLEAKHAGVGLYGGLTCPATGEPGWSATGAARATLRPSKADGTPTLRVSEASRRVRLHAVSIHAPDATAPSESSIGVAVVYADVEVRGSEIVTGRGANGKDGAPAVEGEPTLWRYSPSPQAERDGEGGVSSHIECNTGGWSFGGAGAHARLPRGPEPGLPEGLGGAAGSTELCRRDGSGHGSAGKPGADGDAGAGAQTPGEWDGKSWRPRSGADGTAGTPGGGGGGGGAGTHSPPLGGGGSGGPGTCGGGGGHGGGGGGASVAVLAIGGRVRVAASTITTRNAGDGGAGSPGRASRFGRDGGYTGDFPKGTGCQGARGGAGGFGGAGGGGAGGVAAAVLASPATDVVLSDDVKVSLGSAGAAGVGGAADNGGSQGVSAPIARMP